MVGHEEEQRDEHHDERLAQCEEEGHAVQERKRDGVRDGLSMSSVTRLGGRGGGGGGEEVEEGREVEDTGGGEERRDERMTYPVVPWLVACIALRDVRVVDIDVPPRAAERGVVVRANHPKRGVRSARFAHPAKRRKLAFFFCLCCICCIMACACWGVIPAGIPPAPPVEDPPVPGVPPPMAAWI